MSKVDTLVSYGLTEVGKPYRYGEEGPNAFDCSGLMQWIFGHVGVQLPRTAREQQKFATRVSSPRVGDLVFYNTPATHVGLYLGAGKMLHAPNSRSKVKVADVYGSPTYGRVSGIGAPGGVVGQAVADTAGSAVFNIAGFMSSLRSGLVTIAIAGGGIALIALGAWQSTKGRET
ncbi:MAG TPA: C40 family peptidase [Asanoa sp.]|nr:C40 family peptidase [Asanoa sp.]